MIDSIREDLILIHENIDKRVMKGDTETTHGRFATGGSPVPSLRLGHKRSQSSLWNGAHLGPRVSRSSYHSVPLPSSRLVQAPKREIPSPLGRIQSTPNR